MSEYSLLDALRDEQDSLLALLEHAHAAHLPEAAYLEWALTDVVDAYRQLKAGTITWLQAAQAFQSGSNAQMECDNALFEFNHADDAEWQAAKAAAANPIETSKGLYVKQVGDFEWKAK